MQCRVCGAEFIHSSDGGYGVMPTCIGCGEQSESPKVVKCPGCQHRVSVSSEEFLSQIIEECVWG